MGRSPSPIWASKPASERRRAGLASRRSARWLTLAWLGLGAAACRGEYSQPPTACDDHCRAIERADCAEDYPADCVRDCESSRSSGACDGAWQSLDDCYAAADASSFTCIDERSQPGRICVPERRDLSECLSPGSGACFDQCLRQADACGASLSDCEGDCHGPAPGCELVSHAYQACLLTYPVECRAWFEADPRPLEEVPCSAEALDVLACDK